MLKRSVKSRKLASLELNNEDKDTDNIIKTLGFKFIYGYKMALIDFYCSQIVYKLYYYLYPNNGALQAMMSHISQK